MLFFLSRLLRRLSSSSIQIRLIDVCKDAARISGISITYVLNKSLEKNKKPELYSPGGICTYVKIYEKSSSTVAVMAP